MLDIPVKERKRGALKGLKGNCIVDLRILSTMRMCRIICVQRIRTFFS